MDSDIDYYNYLNNTKARDKVLEIVTQFNLTDIYREFHPHKKDIHGVSQPTSNIFFLISNTFLNIIQESELKSLITLQFYLVLNSMNLHIEKVYGSLLIHYYMTMNFLKQLTKNT